MKVVMMRQPYPNELMHHGILRMKWGVRRFQNPDGTLTPAGRKRYLGSDGKSLTDKGKEHYINEAERKVSNNFEKNLQKRQDESDYMLQTKHLSFGLKGFPGTKKYKESLEKYRHDIDEAYKESLKQTIEDLDNILGPDATKEVNAVVLNYLNSEEFNNRFWSDYMDQEYE